MSRAPRSAFAGIFFLALSVILFQIALTRVFAIMMWHHLTYMVVSIALLGFGAAGSLLTARRAATASGSAMPAIARATAGYGLSVIAAFIAAGHVPINSLELWTDKVNLLRLLLIYALISVPFLLGGVAIGLALTRYVGQVNRLYFTDLVGSAAGGAASVWLLGQFGGTTTVVIAAALGLVGAFCFSLGAGAGTRLLAGGSLLAGLVACALFTGTGSALGLPTVEWHPPFAPKKELHPYYGDPGLDRIWSATAEVEVGPEESRGPMLGGEFGWPFRGQIPGRLVGQDGTAPTMLYRGVGELDGFPFLKTSQTATAHVALEAQGRGEPDVLVIGVGGGVDVAVALAWGAARVTAVEINSAMIAMVTERYDDYLAGLFRPGAHAYSDRIELVRSEGRSYMRSRPDRYDVIQMSGVDTFTALNSGAYTLSESYLYTIEAVQEFYEHLNEGGFVNYSRFILTYPKKPRETFRLANIAYTALAELGVEDPASQIAVFQGERWASTMIKRGPFTRAEIDALERHARTYAFLGLVYDPLRPADEPIGLEMRQVGQVRTVRNMMEGPIGAILPGDSGPETIKQAVERLADVYVARHDGPPAAERDALESLLELVPEAERESAAAKVRAWLDGDPFNAGLQMELWRQTRQNYATLLRGSEAERRAFMDAYEYDVSACTDDKPFFFNYYRYGHLFGGRAKDVGPENEVTEIYHPDYPVGHMVLLASMVQIVALAVLLILLPLRGLARRGVRTPGAWRFFGYFTALGMGFMFVEIVLLQKLVIFLGHPTYALSVVLASLLGFAGLGSFLAGRIVRLSRANLLRIGGAIAVLIVATALFMNHGLPGLLGRPLAVRMVVVVAMILPLGLALGMAFPTGMRVVEARCPDLLPWCWAINGFLSVFSSVFCIVLSMFLGFTVVLWLAAGIYALGFLVMLPGESAPARA